MSKVLLAFYSRTGFTRSIAMQLAETENWEVDEIIDTRGRGGPWGFLRSLLDVALGKYPAIHQPRLDPSKYDLVIIGASVWMRRLCSPVRTYIRKQREHLPNIAFFCTYGGWGAESAVRQCTTLAGKVPVATLAITDDEIEKQAYWPKLDAFTRQIRQTISQ